MEDLFTGVSGAEEMVFKFASLGRYKYACELMAYIGHRRAAVWWGYRCLNSLNRELAEKPPEDIGLDYEAPVPPLPEWAAKKPPAPDPAVLAGIEKELGDMRAKVAAMKAQANPAALKYIQEGKERAFAAFEKANGIHPRELLSLMGGRLKDDPYKINMDAPLFKEIEALKVKLAAQKAETIATIKSVLPPKMPAHEKKLRDNALDAIYRWVAAPDAENSQKCLDAGNAANGTPAGLLSLSAFWSFGNLMPQGDQVIPTPPGLAANGIDKALLMCALAQGGTRKIPERYELYFNMGVEVLSGKDNWEESLALGVVPHRQDKAIPEAKPSTEEQKGNEIGYHHWKTEVPLE
ncbi:hypothetical protein AGMMS50268_15320 [Spirochaetia bacterium]|nr:hypothetical protein AGMMS50268_15320 [Spirochaetia bacterium]